MKTFNLQFLLESLPENTVPRPAAGLAGHAVGELFDKLVETSIHAKFPDRTYRSFELLNEVFRADPSARTSEERLALLGPPALGTLLRRGGQVLRDWTPENPLEEKQNDTADIVVLPTEELDLSLSPVHLVDVKSAQTARPAQPPNIISARKIAAMCKSMLDTANFTSHDFTYVGIYWEPEGDLLRINRAALCELFLIPPESLYINWSAALQIQFHVQDVRQDYDKDVEGWCRDFLHYLLLSAERRQLKFSQDYVEPFKQYRRQDD
jgi:hypothetical protein